MDEQTENLSDLDRLIDTYQTKPETEEAPPKAQAKVENEAAGNLAVWAVRLVEFGFKAVDDRVKYAEETYEEGRDALGPLMGRFNLGASSDKVPFGEEIAAGWFLGKLFKASWLRLRELWAIDKEKARKNGDQRKHETPEPAHPVAGEERPRQEYGHAQSGRAADAGGEGYFLGHEQGP